LPFAKRVIKTEVLTKLICQRRYFYVIRSIKQFADMRNGFRLRKFPFNLILSFHADSKYSMGQ